MWEAAGAGEGEDQGYLGKSLAGAGRKATLGCRFCPVTRPWWLSGTRNSLFQWKESNYPMKDKRKAWRVPFKTKTKKNPVGKKIMTHT